MGWPRDSSTVDTGPLTPGGGLVRDAAPRAARGRVGRVRRLRGRHCPRHRPHDDVPITASGGDKASDEEMGMWRSRDRFHSSSRCNQHESVETLEDGGRPPNAPFKGEDHSRCYPRESPRPPEERAGKKHRQRGVVCGGPTGRRARDPDRDYNVPVKCYDQ
jgi:hypothetical protein